MSQKVGAQEMRDLADLVSFALHEDKNRKRSEIGFAILTFDVNETKGGMTNYISNCQRADMIKDLREFIDRNETQPPFHTPGRKLIFKNILRNEKKKLTPEELEKCYNILGKIEKIKGQISTIQNLADYIASNDTLVDFTLKVPEKTIYGGNKAPENLRESNMPKGISIMKSPDLKSSFFEMISDSMKNVLNSEFEDFDNRISIKIKETEALSLLGVLLGVRLNEMEALKDELRNFGLKI